MDAEAREHLRIEEEIRAAIEGRKLSYLERLPVDSLPLSASPSPAAKTHGPHLATVA